VQQWVRRYRKLTQHSETPTHRVRIRTFLFEGIKQFQVRLVVENISLLLHAAIFLFFAGLVEFLFAINDEVAQVVVAVIGFFAALYFILTSLPVLFQKCPFQTPLTAVFWYMAHVIMITILSPFTFSSHIRTRIEELWRHTKGGFDEHILDAVKGNKTIDQKAVKMTLGMCRGDTEVEAFLDAVPGYLQIDDKPGTRFGDIGSLLDPKEHDLPLGQRMVHLFSSCINGSGKMDEVERCRRAITCSRVIFELSKTFSSVKGFTLDLPKSVGHKLWQLSHDLDPKIAFEAVRAIAVLERALLKQLFDAKDSNDLAKSVETAELLAAAIGEDDPTSSRHRTGPRDDDRSDGHLLAVTEFTSRILELTNRSWQPTRNDIEDMKVAFDELCRGLNGSTFSPSTQERLISVFNETRQAHIASGSTGTVYPQFTLNSEHWLISRFPCLDNQSSTESHHLAIIGSLQPLVSTVDAQHRELPRIS
jgi:hypothetical protein